MANKITPGSGITNEGGGWYSVPTENYYAIDWIIKYVKGDSTLITLSFAWVCSETKGPGIAEKIYISEKANTNVLSDLTCVMNASKTRGIWIECPKRAEKMLIKIEFTDGTTGAVNVYAMTDYNE